MEPMGVDLLSMLPFIDREVCERVRRITKRDIMEREPHHHDEFHIRVIEDPQHLYQTLATNMYRRIALAAEEDRTFVGVFPVGPVGQYPRLAKLISEGDVTLDHCEFFFLDEYAYEDGQTIDKSSPWSFEFVAYHSLFDRIPQVMVDPGRIHFPGPDNIDHYDEMILQASDGQRADVVYGGIGWSGHFAFWEPHLREQFDSDEQWQKAHSAFVRLHPMSILHNSLRAGGDWSSVPPCAYTVGPAVILGAGYRSFWLDAYLGSGMSWQRFIGRLAAHGPVTPQIPATYLQTLPGDVVFLGAVAEDIAGPKASWQ